MLKSESILNSRELYLLSTANSGCKLLYAPLADALVVVSNDDIISLAEAVEHPESASDNTKEVLTELCNVVPVCERENQVRGIEDFINLSILPNNICNFSCSYCYSAKGRSSQQLSLRQVKQIIDYFLSPKRNNASKLTVSIFGGGEPLISWKSIVAPAIEYLYKIAEAQRRMVITTLITNGSMIPDGFIEMCRQYSIDIVCSYEILEDVQNTQRKHFHTVTNNIFTLVAEGVVPAINSVITPLNVCRQCEMIETLHHRFPKIRYVSFEPVIDPTLDNRADFYKRFATEFIDALQLAEKYGIILTCSTLRNVDVTVDRYCAGELALCADGSLSICPCVSSPDEPNFGQYIYGKVYDLEIFIDEERLNTLLSHNVYKQPWCQRCFAKWNCGGGCMNTLIQNNSKPDADYCRFMKSFLKYTLTKRLDKTYIEETGKSIKEIIGNYEYFIEEQHL